MSKSILEVWDYRLSIAAPLLYRGGAPSKKGNGEGSDNWVVCVYAQDDRNAPLEYHDTGLLPVEGDIHEGKGIDACYEFLRSVRDKYSRGDIEALKPLVAKIRAADLLRQKATDAYNEVMMHGGAT